MMKDVLRQVTVLVSAVIAIVGSFVGSGAAGGVPITKAAGGGLAADATTIAPGGSAFAIWSVIYLGLVAYAIWQLLPRQRTSPRQRALGYPVALSLLLNAAWILSIQFNLLGLSVPVIALLLAVLVWCLTITLRTPAEGRIEQLLTDGTLGLYLGWVTIATAANVTAWLVAIGFRGGGIPRDVWSVAIILVAGVIGVLVAIRSHGRISPALSLCWGLVWVAAARFTGDLVSVPTAIAAIVALVAVLAVTAMLAVTVGLRLSR
jgi:hypothetical protein